MPIYCLTNTPEDPIDIYLKYSSCIVSANNEEEARTIHPNKLITYGGIKNPDYIPGSKNKTNKNKIIIVWLYKNNYGLLEHSTPSDRNWIPFSDRDKLTVELIENTSLPSGVISSIYNDIPIEDLPKTYTDKIMKVLNNPVTEFISDRARIENIRKEIERSSGNAERSLQEREERKIRKEREKSEKKDSKKEKEKEREKE